MAGREKRRQAAALDSDEKRLRRRQEEAAILLRKIRGSICFPLSSIARLSKPSLSTVTAGAKTCGGRRRRARALGRRGGGRRALPVCGAPPLPELLLRRRRCRHCVPAPMVLFPPPPHKISFLPLQISPPISTNCFRSSPCAPHVRGGVCDCSACSYDAPVGTDVLSLLHKDCHTSRLSVLLRVLLVVQQLLQQNKHCSKRDIYYMYPSFFGEQATVDRAINDICILFKCSRHNLNVVANCNLAPLAVCSLVMGWIRFMEGEKKVYCITNVNAVFSIPVDIEAIKDMVCVAEYILVVEKETVFQRLANDKFCEKNRCVVITVRKRLPRYSNKKACSLFLRYLVEQLHLPVYCLVDSDPYGFDILATYKFGSLICSYHTFLHHLPSIAGLGLFAFELIFCYLCVLALFEKLAYDANLLRVPNIRWLGVFTSDLEEYCLPDCCRLHLSPEDRRKAEGILTRCYLNKEAPEWRSELEAMLQKGVKFEIEALSACSISFLSEEYIPQKIKQGRHL
ncbi:hypothetical protein EJB05_04449, partial [Eragrostis curvula]